MLRPLQHLYSKLVPLPLRDAVRPLKTPRLSFIRAYNRAKSGGRVVTGPFAGMVFPGSIANQGMLLGTWELELAAVIEEIAGRGYERVVNIGAAEGYYAVGLASRLPSARILAFEALADQQACLRELAEANSVPGRITVLGRCEPKDLESSLDGPTKTFVMMDVEGYEVTLLEPERIPALAGVDLLVECHDLYVAGCMETISQRFSPTHEVSAISGRWRTLDDYPFANRLTRHPLLAEQALFTMNEGRPCLMSWLWMQSRNPSRREQIGQEP